MDGDVARWEYALEGAREAVARIKTTYRAGDSRGAAEAAFWIAALESELSRPSGGLKPGSAWARRCEAAKVRDLLEGLRYVRNHAAHGLAHLAELGGGLTFPITFPVSIDASLLWQRDNLPGPGRDEPSGLFEAYVRRLAGQDVYSTLDQALMWVNDRAAEVL